ncbi:MAG TPA: type II secretion system F family protein [Phycisphaerae bacterium]|nr:type II secretion system F family protein [Phycisphaerae bacterium]
MAVFTYSARDDAGKMVQGEVTAPTQTDAARSIRNEGKFVTRIEEKGGAAAGKATKARFKEANAPAVSGKKPLFKEKLNPQDVIFFTSQLGVMVDTGVSLAEALDACVHPGNSPRFGRALNQVIEQVRAGTEFSAALAEHPTVFPSLYISLIKASEASGQLAPILERLSDYLERQRDLKKKIKSAITYPIVMCIFALGTTAFLVSFVLPRFAEIYSGREDALPKLTKWLLGFADLMSSYGLYVLGASILACGGAWYYFRTPAGRWRADGLRLGMPLVGKLFHKSTLARSLRTLGTMIQSGVSMLDSVTLTTQASGSLHYEQMWTTVRERIERGQQISEALADSPHIPKSVIKMLGAGERSGRLGTVMDRVANFCEAEMNVAIKTLTSLIEPAIVMFLGVVVGGLVLAMLLPIFSISKVM